MTDRFQSGYRILGGINGHRWYVNAAGALAAYAACDPRAEVDREAYLSAFCFDADFRAYLEGTGSTKGYDGRCWTPFIKWDIDHENDLERALSEARRLTGQILGRYPNLDEDDLLLFFSGAKGFHVELPVFWTPAPSLDFNRVARRFAEGFAQLAGASIDTGIYDKVRAYRAPNSRHPKTGLHKRRLTHDELMGLSLDGIRALAEHAEPFALSALPPMCEQGARDWSDAAALVRKEAEGKAQRRAAVANGTPTLNRQTLDFVRDGADQGDRHRLLFSAAANLAEFSCPPALAHALLTDAALDSGLPPTEVHRQIECGLGHNPVEGNGHE
jgi:hypothetical protein